jgi:hypothetical protein
MSIEKDNGIKDMNSKLKKPTNQMGFLQNQNVRISDKVVVAMAHNNEDDKEKFIRHVSIDKLQEESKKIKQVGVNFRDPNAFSNSHSLYYESIYSPFINGLLTPTKDWSPPHDYKFNFKKENIIKLIDETIKLFEA